MERCRRHGSSRLHLWLFYIWLDRWRGRQAGCGDRAMVWCRSHADISCLYGAVGRGVITRHPAVPNHDAAGLSVGQHMDRAVAFAGIWNPVWSSHGVGSARRISSDALDDFRFLIGQLLKKDI